MRQLIRPGNGETGARIKPWALLYPEIADLLKLEDNFSGLRLAAIEWTVRGTGVGSAVPVTPRVILRQL